MSVGLNTAGWQANLELEFSPRPTKTVLSRKSQFGPLTVQKPLYPEGAVCHIYLLHPPGGVVGGDSLNITAHVKAGSHALLTTPGATKFYRSGGAVATQVQNLTVESNASVEWLPQENIFFPGAYCNLETTIKLSRDAHFIGWEINCLGRPANRESFSFGELESGISIYREDEPILLERLFIDGEQDLAMLSGLRSFPVNANLYVTGVRSETLEKIQSRFPDLIDASIGHTLLDDLLVSRYLGHSTEQARQLFTQIWTMVRPETCGLNASCPRIWST